MMINCKQAAELAYQSLDRPLAWRDRLQLRMHLLMCGGCNAFRKQSQALDRLLQMRFHDLVTGDLDAEFDGMPQEVCERLKQKLREATGSG